MTKLTGTLPDHPDCLNCGAELLGQYCGQCGQRASSRLISLWELLRDAFGDLLELDSRLWRTLIPLLAKPGLLTRDYLEGRRARYMPPFRMYLVLSVIFFVVAFFDPRDDLSLLFEPEPAPAPQEVAQEREAVRDEVSEELAKEGVVLPESLEDEDGGINVQLGTVEPGEGGFSFSYDEETGECDVNDQDLQELPEWFQRRLTRERLQGICERISADGAKTFTDLILDNIPVALIVLLPVMALVLKGLYPLSRRYFVEHLLFFVHFHSFFFLILTLQVLFARATTLVGVPEAIEVLVLVAASLYIPVYLYRAMRAVYGQGHFVTLFKFITLAIAYSMGATVTMLGALLFALVAV